MCSCARLCAYMSFSVLLAGCSDYAIKPEPRKAAKDYTVKPELEPNKDLPRKAVATPSMSSHALFGCNCRSNISRVRSHVTHGRLGAGAFDRLSRVRSHVTDGRLGDSVLPPHLQLKWWSSSSVAGRATPPFRCAFVSANVRSRSKLAHIMDGPRIRSSSNVE